VIDGNGNRADLRYDGHGRQELRCQFTKFPSLPMLRRWFACRASFYPDCRIT